MSFRVDINQAALAGYLNRGSEPQAALREKATALKEGVDQRAEAFRNTGHYAVRTYVRKYRHGYQVINADTFSFIVEYGSQNNPPYRAMTGTAVQVFGTAFKEQLKPEEEAVDDGS